MLPRGASFFDIWDVLLYMIVRKFKQVVFSLKQSMIKFGIIQKISIKMGGCISAAQEEINNIRAGKTLSQTTKDGSSVFDVEVLSRPSKRKLTNKENFDSSGKTLEAIRQREERQILTLNLKELAKKADLKKKFKASGLNDLVEVIKDDVPAKMIEVLHLEHHQLSSLPDLSYFFNLRKVYLHQNQFESIVDLSSLKKLTYLNMSKNRIEKISNLQNMTNLQELILNDNKIEKIEKLDDLTSLRVLSLQKNKISKVEGLRNLKKLKVLNLKGNLLEFIADLWYLNQLSSLDLDENPLSFRTCQTALILLKSRNVKVTVGTFFEE